MTKKHPKKMKNPYYSQTFARYSAVFCTVLLLLSALTIYYSSQNKKTQLLSSMKLICNHVSQEYENIKGNFWQVYMPVFEASTENVSLMTKCFNDPDGLTPQERGQLSELLLDMCIRDSRIDWIAVCPADQDFAWMQSVNSSSLQQLPQDFPWELDPSGKSSLTVYGVTDDTPGSIFSDVFVLRGNAPFDLSGSILTGYRTDTLAVAAGFIPNAVSTMEYYILSDGAVVYHSGGNYDISSLYQPSGSFSGIRKVNGSACYLIAMPLDSASSYVVCSVSYGDMLHAIHRDTPLMLLVFLAFFGFTVFVRNSIMQQITREVSVIQNGLSILSDNHLDYRLPTDFHQTGLPEIAQDINTMSSRLSESIQKAYYFELKQKEAEMAELQATFNPHFLYNTLEMLRAKSYSNGDTQTAALIADFAAIFRSFIGAKTFVPFREELSFGKRYLSLFAARYGDQVAVHYDIDTALLQYGIIRNVFQLLIENYFVHGFDVSRSDNEICFQGHVTDEENLLICVRDNGCGMSPEDVAALNQRIEEPIRHSKENFGLKNLNQRLKLFYGPGYGLHVERNEAGGLSVYVRIRRLTVEEYEKTKLTESV